MRPYTPRLQGNAQQGAPPCAPTPLVSRENAQQGAPLCAPAPLSHSVGEGLGVRAKKKRERFAPSKPKRCTLISSIRFPLRGGN